MTIEEAKIEIAVLHSVHRGRDAAAEDINRQDFDVDKAIATFNNNPADSPFQHGYLRELIRSRNANQ